MASRVPEVTVSPARVTGAEPSHRGDDETLRGLVLLDLPDFDSVEETHRVEVDRILALVDLMVWVLDPQKYADRVVHKQYLSQFSRHRDVTVVVLNQSDLLAREISKKWGVPVRTLVRRQKATRPQAGLTNSKRRANMSGAFKIPRGRSLAGIRVLLVDDVVTTGATASACARVLKRAGAAHVALLALARTDRRAAVDLSFTRAFTAGGRA